MNLRTFCCCQLLLSVSLPVCEFCEPAGDASCLLIGEKSKLISELTVVVSCCCQLVCLFEMPVVDACCLLDRRKIQMNFRTYCCCQLLLSVSLPVCDASC